MAPHDGVEQLPQLAAAPPSPAESIDEKAAGKALEKRLNSSSASSIDSKLKSDALDDDGEETLFVNGEPVIRSGRDVSRYLIDLRDDGDPSLTFRSLFIGTVFAGLGAALCQVPSSSIRTVIRHKLTPHAPFRSISLSPFRCPCPQYSCCSLSTPSGLFGRGTFLARNGWKARDSPTSPRLSTSSILENSV